MCCIVVCFTCHAEWGDGNASVTMFQALMLKGKKKLAKSKKTKAKNVGEIIKLLLLLWLLFARWLTKSCVSCRQKKEEQAALAKLTSEQKEFTVSWCDTDTSKFLWKIMLRCRWCTARRDFHSTGHVMYRTPCGANVRVVDGQPCGRRYNVSGFVDSGTCNEMTSKISCDRCQHERYFGGPHERYFGGQHERYFGDRCTKKDDFGLGLGLGLG